MNVTQIVVYGNVHVLGVMVWGGISWRYRTPLVVIGGNLTSRRYIYEVLEPVVVPFFSK